MAKYLIKASYSVEGAKGLLEQGGSARREAVTKMIEGLGGTVESFYYAFGEPDAYTIADVPDAVTAAAISLTVNAAGAAAISMTALITPEEIDQASRKSVAYRPPGQ